MSKTKKTAIIAIVLVMAMALASFGFAAWSQQLTVDGTATAVGTWDLKITDIQVSDKSANASVTTAPSVEDGINASAGEVNFALPLDWVEYTITVTNNGTTAADLTAIDFSVSDETNFTFTCYALDTATDVIEAGESCTFTAVLQLNDQDATFDFSNVEINITLDYAQETVVDAAPVPEHTAH